MKRSLSTDSDQPCSTASVDGRTQRVDQLFDALSTYRRRCVLYQLLDDTTTSLDTLADGVAAMEAQRLSEQVPADIRDTVKSALHHQTLPKLAALGVIEYDPQTKTVSYQRPSPPIEELLALARDFDPVSAD